MVLHALKTYSNILYGLSVVCPILVNGISQEYLKGIS